MTGEIECASLAEALEVLRTIKERAQNIPQEWPLMQAAEIVETRTVMNFLASEDPEGHPWKPVKRRMPPPILIKTGRLQREAQAAARNPRISGNEMLIDATEPYYGKFHLTGGVNLPRREWIGMTGEQVDQMAGLVADNAVAFLMTGEM